MERSLAPMGRPTVLLSAGKVKHPMYNWRTVPPGLRAMTTRATHAEIYRPRRLGRRRGHLSGVHHVKRMARSAGGPLRGRIRVVATYGMKRGPHHARLPPSERFCRHAEGFFIHNGRADAQSGVSFTLSAAPVAAQAGQPSRGGGMTGCWASGGAQGRGHASEQAAPQLAAFFRPMPVGHIESMLRHPQVTALLQPARSDSVLAPPSSESSSEEWWKKAETSEAPAPQPTAPDPGSVGASTGAFWSSEPSMPTDAEPVAPSDAFMIGASGGAVCGAAGCDRAVTDFDYRCFTCRQRFCMSHRGAGVDCPACSST